MGDGAMVVENTIPVLGVADVGASVRFYCGVLGFRRDWGGDDQMPEIGSVSRDGHAIMLQRRAGRGQPGCVWIGCAGLVAFWKEIRLGVRVVQGPTARPWAVEMKVLDLDGNVLWFGSEPVEGAVLEAELSGIG